MSKQEIKLQKIKNSCKVTYKIVTVLFVLMIIAFVFLTLSSVICVAGAKEINKAIVESEAITDIETSINIGIFSFNSDIPAVNDYLNNAETKYSLAITLYLILFDLFVISAAVIFGLLNHVFKVLEKSDSPFDEKILKSLGVIFVLITVVVGFSVGAGFALVCALTFWVLYNLYSYGCELQKLSDETL